MSAKKLRKPDRDNCEPVLLVALHSEIERWKVAALAHGMTVKEWAVEILNVASSTGEST